MYLCVFECNKEKRIGKRIAIKCILIVSLCFETIIDNKDYNKYIDIH